jgi:glutamyl/glutaminyl-tRNA synthetase
MKISHVIRGEDHISNTYKQILIFEALGFDVPRFGHLGMILAPDRSKLSKRHGATAVSDFVEQGYLTEALVNFVALLGWAPSDGEEVKPVDAIAADFRIGEISSSNSIFEYDKLRWMNSHYIKMLSIETLKEMLKPYLTQYDLTELSDEQFTRMVEITREPLTLLSDITEAVPYFFGQDVAIDPEVQTEVLDLEESQKVLNDFVEKAQTWEWTEENLHNKLEEFRGSWKEQGIKPKATMWAIRAAISGRTRGADMIGLLEVLGKERTIYRAQKSCKVAK